MKTKVLAIRFVFLIIGLCLLRNSSFSQQNGVLRVLPDSNFYLIKSKPQHQKAYADTLWSEDFDGGLPTCWSIINNNNNTIHYNWIWDTIYRAGQFSLGVSKINSTTKDNGFMLLPMDFYNTPLANGGSPLDTYFQSCAIPISPRASIELRFQEFNRFCCSDRAKVVVQVSTDNFQTFDEYNLRNEHLNFQLSNVEFRSINVSKTLAGQDTAYLRFYLEGMTHYFWMIDDLALVEGNGQEVSELPYEPQASASSPFYTMFPENYIGPLMFRAEVSSTTLDTITGTILSTTVRHDSFLNGAPGVGNVFQQSNPVNVNGMLLPFDSLVVSTITPHFSPTQNGTYSAYFESTSIEYPQIAATDFQFAVSDTVFARDYGNAHRGVSQFFTQGLPGNSIGNRRGVLFEIDSSIAQVQFSSISIYSLRGSEDVELRPVIWEYDTVKYPTTLGVGREVASSLSITITDTSVADSWLTLTLDTGIAMQNIFNSGQFIVGWEERNSSVFGRFDYLVAGVDLDATKLANPKISFGSGGQNGPWQVMDFIPMVRLNVKPIVVGVSEGRLSSVSSLKIYPNPSNGIFRLGNNAIVERVEVYNLKGKKVKTRMNKMSLIDLRGNSKGVYVAQIYLKSGSIVNKKLILK